MSTTRIITAFSTRGKQFKKIETSATTWGELKPALEAEGYDLTKLLATESINRHDLAHEDATLPEDNFTVFLRPKDTKSGISGLENASFKELRASVKENKDVPGFLDHINSTGNYTRIKTDELRELLISWNPEEGATPASTEQPTDHNVALGFINAALINLDSAREANEDDDVEDTLELVVSDLSTLVEELSPESAEAKAEREAQELETEEANQAQADAEELMSGF